MPTVKKTALIKNYRDLRRKLNLNQNDFWNRIGTTQSGGSRYETGRTPPESTQMLVEMAYGSKKNALELLAKIRKVDVATLIEKPKK